MRLIYLIFILSSFQGIASSSAQQEFSQNIGVHTVEYQDLKRNRPILVEIWYPTEQEGPFDFSENEVWVHPKEIRDGLLTEGNHPLILMSHGHNGDRRDRSWLVESLVKSGCIVASVEHYGNSWRSYSPLLSLRFWDRAKDVSFAISKLLKEPFLQNKIDQKRIGFIGYSLGGMTGLALAGAKAQNVKEVIKNLQMTLKEIDPELIEKVDFEEAHRSFFDRRIKAMVLLCPASYVFPPKAFNRIKIPIGLVVSKEDEILPFQEHAFKVIKYLKTAKLKIFSNVSHYAFLNRVSDKGRKIIREEIRSKKVQSDQIKVHQEVSDFVKAFFKEYL